MADTIRVAACNLQAGIGTTKGYWHYLLTGWKYFLPHHSKPVEEAAAFLREQRIDLVALSEVEGGSKRSKGVDQAALLADRTPLEHHVFFPTLVTGSRINQGNAVCSRFPVRRVQNHALSGSGEPRYVGEAEVEINGHTIHVFATHLSLERKVRRPQIEDLVDIINACDHPSILAGDFNISEAAELDLISEGHLQQVDAVPTFPSWSPKKHLDHLFVSDDFRVIDGYSFDDFLFSDHLPFVAELEVPEAS